MKSQIERYCFREILAKIQSEGKVQLKNKPLNNVMTTTYHPCVVVKLLRAVIVEHLENTRQFLNTQNLKTVNKHSTIHTHTQIPVMTYHTLTASLGVVNSLFFLLFCFDGTPQK